EVVPSRPRRGGDELLPERARSAGAGAAHFVVAAKAPTADARLRERLWTPDPPPRPRTPGRRNHRLGHPGRRHGVPERAVWGQVSPFRDGPRAVRRSGALRPDFRGLAVHAPAAGHLY